MALSPKVRASTATPSRPKVAAALPLPQEDVAQTLREGPLHAAVDKDEQQRQPDTPESATSTPRTTLSLQQMRRAHQLFELYNWVRGAQRRRPAPALPAAFAQHTSSSSTAHPTGDGSDNEEDDEIILWEETTDSATASPQCLYRSSSSGATPKSVQQRQQQQRRQGQQQRHVCSRRALRREIFHLTDKNDEVLTTLVSLRPPPDASSAAAEDTPPPFSMAAAYYARRHAASLRIVEEELVAMSRWKSTQRQMKRDNQEAQGQVQRGQSFLPAAAAWREPSMPPGTRGGTMLAGASWQMGDPTATIVEPSSAGVPFSYFAFFILGECFPFFFPSWKPREAAAREGSEDGRPGSRQGAEGRGPTLGTAPAASMEEEEEHHGPDARGYGFVLSPLQPERLAAAKELFYEMDTNADGLVCWDDFAAYVLLKMQQCSNNNSSTEAERGQTDGNGRAVSDKEGVAGGGATLEYALRFAPTPVNCNPWQTAYPLVHHLYHREPIKHLCVCVRARKYVTAADDGLVKLWKGDPRLPDAHGKASLVHERNLLSVQSCVMGLALSTPSLGDAEVVAVIAMDGTLTLIRTASGEVVRSLLGVKAARRSGGGQAAASTSRGKNPARGPTATTVTTTARPAAHQSTVSDTCATTEDGGAAVLRMPFTISAYRSDAMEIFFGESNQYFHGLTVVPPPFEHLKRPVATTSDLLLDFGLGEESAGVVGDTIPAKDGNHHHRSSSSGEADCWFATSVALAHIVPTSANSPLLRRTALRYHRRPRGNAAQTGVDDGSRRTAATGAQMLPNPPAALGMAAPAFALDGDHGGGATGNMCHVRSPYLTDDGGKAAVSSASASHPRQRRGDGEGTGTDEGGVFAMLGFENGLLQLYELRRGWFCENQLSATRVEPPAALAPALIVRLHAAAIRGITLSEPSDLAFTASDDGTVCVRQLSRLEVPLMRLGDGATPPLSASLGTAQQLLGRHAHGHTSRIVCAAWNESSHTLVTGGRDYMLYYWSPRSHRPLRRLDLRTVRSPHDGGGGPNEEEDGAGEGGHASSFGASGYPVDVAFIDDTSRGDPGTSATAAMGSTGRTGGGASPLRLLVLDSKRVLRILNALTNQLLCVLVDDSAASLALGEMHVARFDKQNARLVLGGRCLRVWDLLGNDGSYPPSYTGHRKPVFFLKWSHALRAYVTADEDHICVWQLSFAKYEVAHEQRRWRREARRLFLEQQIEQAERRAAERAVARQKRRRLAGTTTTTTATTTTTTTTRPRDGGGASRLDSSLARESEEEEEEEDDRLTAEGEDSSSDGDSRHDAALPEPPPDFDPRYPTIDDANPHNQSYHRSATRLLRSWRVAAGIRAVTMTELPSSSIPNTASPLGATKRKGSSGNGDSGDERERVSIFSHANVTVSANMEGLFAALLREPAIVQYNLFNGFPLRRFAFPEGSSELSSLFISLVPAATGGGALADARDDAGDHQRPTLCAAYDTSLTSGLVAVYLVNHDSDGEAAVNATASAAGRGGDGVSAAAVDSRLALPPLEEDIIHRTVHAAGASRSVKAAARGGGEADGSPRTGQRPLPRRGGGGGEGIPSASPPALQVRPHRHLVFRQTPVASVVLVASLGLVVVGGLGSLHFSPVGNVTTRALVCQSLEEQHEAMRRRNSHAAASSKNRSSTSREASAGDRRGGGVGRSGTGSSGVDGDAESSPSNLLPPQTRVCWAAVCPGRLVRLPPTTPAEETARMEGAMELLSLLNPRQQQQQQDEVRQKWPKAPPPAAQRLSIARSDIPARLTSGKESEGLGATTTTTTTTVGTAAGAAAAAHVDDAAAFFATAQAAGVGFLGHLCPVPHTPYIFSGSNVGTLQLWGLRTACELARFSATLALDTITSMELFTAAHPRPSPSSPNETTNGSSSPSSSWTDCYLAVGSQSGFVALFDMSELALHDPGLVEGRATATAAATVPAGSANRETRVRGRVEEGEVAYISGGGGGGGGGSSRHTHRQPPSASCELGLEQKVLLLDRWRAHRQDVRSISLARLEIRREKWLPGRPGRGTSSDTSTPSLRSLSSPLLPDEGVHFGGGGGGVARETRVLTLVTASEDSYIYVWQWTSTMRHGVSTGSVLNCLGCFGGDSAALHANRSTPSFQAPPLFELPSRFLQPYEAARRLYVLRRLVVDHRLFLVSHKNFVAVIKKAKEERAAATAAVKKNRLLVDNDGNTNAAAAAATAAYEEEWSEQQYKQIYARQLEMAIRVMEEDARQMRMRDPAWALGLVGSLGLRTTEETAALQRLRGLRREKVQTLLAMVDTAAAAEDAAEKMRHEASGITATNPHSDLLALYNSSKNGEGPLFSSVSCRREKGGGGGGGGGDGDAASSPALSFFDKGGLEGLRYWQRICGFDPADAAADSSSQSRSLGPSFLGKHTGVKDADGDGADGADEGKAPCGQASIAMTMLDGELDAFFETEEEGEGDSRVHKANKSASPPARTFGETSTTSLETDATTSATTTSTATTANTISQVPFLSVPPIRPFTFPQGEGGQQHDPTMPDTSPPAGYVSAFADLQTHGLSGRHAPPGDEKGSQRAKTASSPEERVTAEDSTADSTSLVCLPYVFTFMRGTYPDANVRECVSRIVRELQPWTRRFRKALQQHEKALAAAAAVAAAERQRRESHGFRPSVENFFELSMDSDARRRKRRGFDRSAAAAQSKEAVAEAMVGTTAPLSDTKRQEEQRQSGGEDGTAVAALREGGSATLSAAALLPHTQSYSPTSLAQTTRTASGNERGRSPPPSVLIPAAESISLAAPEEEEEEGGKTSGDLDGSGGQDGCEENSHTQNPLGASTASDSSVDAIAAPRSTDTRAMSYSGDSDDENGGSADSPAPSVSFAQGRTALRVAFGGKAGANAAPVVLRVSPELAGSTPSCSSSRSHTPSTSQLDRLPPRSTPLPPQPSAKASHASNNASSSSYAAAGSTMAAKALQIIAAPFRSQVATAAAAAAGGGGGGVGGGKKSRRNSSHTRGATTASRHSIHSQKSGDGNDGGEEEEGKEEDEELRPPPEHEIDDIVLDGEDAARVMQVAYMHRRRVEALGRLMELQQCELRDRIVRERHHGRGNRQLAAEAGLVGLADYHDFGATGTAHVFFGAEKALLDESAAAAAFRKKRNIAGTNLVRQLTRPSFAPEEENSSASAGDGEGDAQDGEEDGEETMTDWYAARERRRLARRRGDALWDPSRVMLTLMDWDSPALDPTSHPGKGSGDGAAPVASREEDPWRFLASKSGSGGENQNEADAGLALPDFLPGFLSPFGDPTTTMPGVGGDDDEQARRRHPPDPSLPIGQAYRVLYGSGGGAEVGEDSGGGGHPCSIVEQGRGQQQQQQPNLNAVVAREMQEMKERRRRLLMERDALSAALASDEAANGTVSEGGGTPWDPEGNAYGGGKDGSDTSFPTASPLSPPTRTTAEVKSENGTAQGSPQPPQQQQQQQPTVRTQRLFERRQRKGVVGSTDLSQPTIH